MRKYNLIQIFSYVICLGSFLFLFYKYDSLPNSVPLHTNIKGEIDNWGSKSSLILFPIINLIIIIILSFFIKKPEMANYLVKITEKNKDLMYSKMKVFISATSLIISIIFLFLLLDSMMLIKIGNTNYIVFFVFIMILPLFIKYNF